MNPRRSIAIGATLAAALASFGALGAAPALAAPSSLALSNPAAISPPDNTPAGVTSQLTVSGQTGLITDLDVTLSNVTGAYPADLDVLLLGPTGKAVMLMSDSCGADDLANVTFRVDDEATAPFPDALCAPGSFFPTNTDTDDTGFTKPNAGSLGAFDGLSPNGLWTLVVADDAGGDANAISGGFTLSFQLSDETAPVVTVGKKPKPSTKSTQKVSFTADDAGSTFECNLDGLGWNTCKSPAKFKKLTVGKHKVQIRATDPSGNLGAPAKTTLKVLPKKK